MTGISVITKRSSTCSLGGKKMPAAAFFVCVFGFVLGRASNQAVGGA